MFNAQATETVISDLLFRRFRKYVLSGGRPAGHVDEHSDYTDPCVTHMGSKLTSRKRATLSKLDAFLSLFSFSLQYLLTNHATKQPRPNTVSSLQRFFFSYEKKRKTNHSNGIALAFHNQHWKHAIVCVCGGGGGGGDDLNYTLPPLAAFLFKDTALYY